MRGSPQSLVPSNPNQAFRIIATLLTTSLKNTDYLLFDVRDNPGGYLTYANLLPQLFVPQIRIGSGRAVVSELNKVLFTKLQEFTWVAALDNATSRYTESVYFDKPEAMSTFGGVYLKPVGVFTNAKCYSSCDLFSANMQDSAAAIIFGEDE